MKALILAAGRGARMKTLTERKPKGLVEFRGKPLIEWQLDAIRASGIDEIGIVTGYQSDSFKSYNLREFYNSQWAETQMVSSLMCACEWLENGPCVISYSDIYYDVSGPQLLVECGSDLAITYDPHWLQLWAKRFNDPLEDAETFKLNQEGNIKEIGNKPASNNDVEGQYMGLLRFTPYAWLEVRRIWESLASSERERLHMTGLLQKVIEAGSLKIEALPYNGEWAEFDSIADLGQLED